MSPNKNMTEILHYLTIKGYTYQHRVMIDENTSVDRLLILSPDNIEVFCCSGGYKGIECILAMNYLTFP